MGEGYRPNRVPDLLGYMDIILRTSQRFVQAADLKKSRHKISDITVWARCFLLFIKVVEGYRPKRVPDLLGYMDIILRTSQQFPRLTWADYDARFRQAVAGDSERQWATLDAGLYTECVTTQAGQWVAEAHREEARDWEHSRKSMRSRQEQPVDTERSMMEPSKVVCGKFNQYRGDCRFGSRCKFAHICSKCRGPHPRVLARKKMKGGGGFVEKIFMSLYPLRIDVTLLSL